MKLLGWDTVSALSVGLANQALEAGQETLVSAFAHRGDGLVMEGRFGPWQIVSGGALGLLHMDLHIREGVARGLPGMARRKIDLAGIVLRIEVPLALVPSPDGVGPTELRFWAQDDQTAKRDLIRPLGLTDPKGRLDDIASEMLQLALCECLSANMENISYVFAQVSPHQAKAEDWAATPHLAWACLGTGDGRQYLAILGSMAPPRPDMAPDKIDPEVISGQGTAYIALSRQLYVERVLAPWLTANFRPKAAFRLDGGAVRLARPVHLPPVPSKIGDLHPVIDAMHFAVEPGGLGLRLQAHADAMGATVRVEMALHMALYLDKATGKVGLRPDPHPKVSHRVEGHGIFGWLVELIVNIVIAVTGTSIADVAKGIAAGMQNLNTPGASAVRWHGVRDFHITEASCDQNLWFADTRPA